MDINQKKLRATIFYMIVMGLLILAASYLVHRMINEHLVGRGNQLSLFDFIPIYRDKKVEGISAAVLVSEQTAAFLAKNGSEENDLETYAQIMTGYREQAEYWNTYLDSRKYKTTTIGDGELASGLDNYNLLVLPFALCLSEQQLESVKFFLEQGKGLILSHSSGNRDENGVERPNWSLTSDVLGGHPFYPQVHDKKNAGIQLIANSPLTVNIPPGSAIEVTTYDQPMAMNLVESRTKEGAFWRNTGDKEHLELPQYTSIAHGNYLRGRFVWIGFNPSSIVNDVDYWGVFDKLLANMVDWASYKTVAGKVVWQNTRAAATFAVIPQRDYSRALSVHKIFNKHNIRPVFFIDYHQTSLYRMIIDQIVREVDIGLQIGDAFSSSEERRIEKNKNLRKYKVDFEKSLHTEVSGYEELSRKDVNFDAMARASFDYVWLREEQRAVPYTGRVTMQPLFRKRKDPVLIFQSARNDIKLIEELGITDPEDLYIAMRNDFDAVYRVGGLYSITLHSHIIGNERYHQVLDDLLSYIQSKNVWIASPSELAKWWRKHDNVTVRIQETPRRINLMITNESRQHIDYTTVNLYPVIMPESISIRAERINTPIPEYRIANQHERIDLVITDLGKGESRTYFIDFR